MNPGKLPKPAKLAERIQACLDQATQLNQSAPISQVLALMAEARGLAIALPDPMNQIFYLNAAAEICPTLALETLGLDILEDALKQIEHSAKAAQADEFGSAEENAQTIRAWGLAEVGPTLVKLGRPARGFALLQEARARWEAIAHDIDGQEIALSQIAYAYGELGREEEAIALAQRLPDHRSDFLIFGPLSLFYLAQQDYPRLVKIIEAGANRAQQNWSRYQWMQPWAGLCRDATLEPLVRLCFETGDRTSLLPLLAQLQSPYAQVNLRVAIASTLLRQKEEDAALRYLEDADEICQTVAETELRQVLRRLVDHSLSHGKE